MTPIRRAVQGPLALGASWLLAACGGDGATPTPAPTPTPTIGEALVAPVSWDNAVVYFVMTDRFLNGDPSNDGSYGRAPDGGDEVGTFHGGDLAGLTTKLEEGWFNRLGVTALWITAPYEQVHGWVPGGSGDFQHYAYHGYYALDFTRLDANMGTEEELQALVATAHAHGIRVILDVVMNHPGYATLTDLDTYGVDVLKPGFEGATLSDYYSYIDFNSPNFADWWGVNWIRAGLGGGYETGGTDDLTMGVAYLPDFKTEATEVGIGLPPFYANKPDTGAVEDPDATVREYLVTWLTDWVALYGIDGFRCDTAKHVELDAWAELKTAGHSALASWRAAHPGEGFPDGAYLDPAQPFWMVGEVFPHGVSRDDYFNNGFDALINFDYQVEAASALDNYGDVDETWGSYARSLNDDTDFNVLSYLSSHDTSLFFDEYADGDLEQQKRAAPLLLFTPGAVQIYYGDENARPLGPSVSDAKQATRSDYQWGANPEVMAHWRKIGQFRRLHPAIGAGTHEKLADSPYTFTRVLGDDRVVISLGASGTVEIPAGGFADGSSVRDRYTGAVVEVSGGKVTVDAHAEGVVLLEAAP